MSRTSARRGTDEKTLTTWVVCVSYPREWEEVRDMCLREMPDCKPVQSLPLARLTDECDVRAAFFVGDKRRGTRETYLTDAVPVSKYWTPSGDFGGELNTGPFLERLGRLCMPADKDGGASIKCRDGDLRIAYG